MWPKPASFVRFEDLRADTCRWPVGGQLGGLSFSAVSPSSPVAPGAKSIVGSRSRVHLLRLESEPLGNPTS
jgi:hypothetical protein